MVWGCVSASGMGNLHICEGTINAERYIRFSGEDFKIGQRVITAGTLIRPAEILMLAAVGQPTVTVYKRPVVAVLSTGDELVDIETAAGQGTDNQQQRLCVSGPCRERRMRRALYGHCP